MSRRIIEVDDENQFSLSIGDLMAALLMIFVLLLIGTMLRLHDEFDSKSNVAERYQALQFDLYTDLYNEFEKDLTVWDAEIDSTLTIRFKEPDILFDAGSATIKSSFSAILDDFFPRYISVLQSDKYIEHVEEIRIEGHTSVEGSSGMDDQEAYFYNMKLSQDRTRSVLQYCLNMLDNDIIAWTRERTTANGLSSVKPIGDNDTEEGRKQNRRVEFRVKTDAEEQIREMLKYAEN